MSTRPFSRTRGLALSATFAALISVVAPLTFPLTPEVPLTLQVFVIYLAMMIIGPIYGGLALLIYLLLGAVSIPVFAQMSGGLLTLLGPTGGYLFAFPVATFLGGLVVRKRSPTRRGDVIRLEVAAAVSITVIYSMGVVGLVLSGLPPWPAVFFGAILFIPFDIIKAFVAIPIALRLRWSHLQLPVQAANPTAQ